MIEIIEKLKIYGLKKFFSFAYSELYNRIYMRKIKGSYSQYGEDLILDGMLKYKQKGFYIDIGAYDPDRFSNTKRFYMRGWRGINIEPNVINYKRFLEKRERDINLNIGIGNTTSKLTFYSFIPDTLSTFSKNEAELYQKQGYKLLSKKTVQVKKLSAILSKYAKKHRIDFMSIDTEGFEMEVLKSNDWAKYRPKYICIESDHQNMNKHDYDEKAKIHSFLIKNAYKYNRSTAVNSIYQST